MVRLGAGDPAGVTRPLGEIFELLAADAGGTDAFDQKGVCFHDLGWFKNSITLS